MKNNTNITNASIESAGLPKDYKHAIAEYIWNGFDAKASRVDIRYVSNELGYLHSLSFEDDGEGINHSTLQQSFGNFLDSMKRSTLKRSSYIRGRKGKGRFSFSLFATRATWKTRYRAADGNLREYEILIDRDQKETYEDSFLVDAPPTGTGTSVQLDGIFGLTERNLDAADFLDFLAQEFGWFLFLNKDQGFQITLNGVALHYNHLIAENETVAWTITDEFDHPYTFQVNFIYWKENIGDRYYYYFLNSEKIEVAKELTSFNNNAIQFHHSVYVESSFFNAYGQESMAMSKDENLFSPLQQHVVFKKLMLELRNLLERKQKKYVREHVSENILQGINKKKILPDFDNSSADQKRKNIILNILRELCIAEPKVFTTMKDDYLKAYIGFIDLLLQTDKRQSILSVIEQTLPLGEFERENISQILQDEPK
ncbi:ATP-binding protein [Sphingobacterium paludis]|uniref:Histidine kinase/DNA gyrase B/HSP90-like ATPase n=1 Tax=Sphingobacterium paludis TaxID=1476465 RepID=A0A4R7CV88_9SPHI|nr:ATP-binding protein [Sphingobacterium paludis]TDS12319.1 histidine kinase/DNA gyrase B/HSP90-like ATPase [Sphingobacterium paludis]